MIIRNHVNLIVMECKKYIVVLCIKCWSNIF